ncbi:MAG TPA: heme biosynthesis HemY N-terminal domain-containing protein [Rudaea sp.]
MKLWILLLGLLIVAAAAAFGWQTLAADPGYVLIRFGETRIETSLVFALAALLLGWGLLSLAWRLLRWPRMAWTRRSQRRGRERIAAGLTALAEGRYDQAMRDLERASHQSGLRAPALLAAARAAHARGESARADAALDEAAIAAPAAAQALRARFLLEQGKADAALALLKPGSAVPAAKAGALSPSGWRLLAESASLCGDHAAALEALTALTRRNALAPEVLASLQARVLAAALTAAPDADHLHALWSSLSRAQRGVPEALAAYARRAAGLGQMLAAIDELEAGLRRGWSDQLLRAYAELGEAEAPVRLRHAEGWLAQQPNHPGLLLALGRLCIQCELWGKARDYLERGLALASSAPLWECLGDCCTGQGEAADAVRCYRNALRSARGEPTRALADPIRAPLDTRASIVEERSEHGVPRLALPSSVPDV